MTTINFRVDEKLKKDCENIFDQLGLSMSAALTIFLKAVSRCDGIPFSLSIPNEETLESVRDIEEGRDLTKYSSIEEMRKDLGL